jgi:hypothetical protein
MRLFAPNLIEIVSYRTIAQVTATDGPDPMITNTTTTTGTTTTTK